MAEPVEIPNIERLRLEPGDILVLTYPQKLTAEHAQVIREHLVQRFGGADIPVVVIDSGGRLQVVNKAELEAVQ